MAEHYEIRPDQRGLAMRIAQRALRVANGLSTARPGYVYIPNKGADGTGDGTGTWIGSGPLGNGGVAPWIGDTTVPGRPVGITASSSGGVLVASWGGELEGGVPEDFGHVTIFASCDGAEAALGDLTVAGSVSTGEYVGGDEVEVWAVAYDLARNPSTGELDPNVSDESDHVTVTVVDLSSEAMDVANAVGQHFWSDNAGVHVSTEERDAEGESNVLMNALGILLRAASKNLVSVTPSGFAVYDETGRVIAQLTGTSSQIGPSNGGNTVTTASGVAVRSGTTELATFGPRLVELGKNSAGSSLSLCGGNGRVEYGSSTGLILYKQTGTRCFLQLLPDGGVTLHSYDQLDYGSRISLSRSGDAGVATIDSDRIDMTWGSGGLRGNVMRQIWSGSAGTNATISSDDFPKYNVFLAQTASNWHMLLGIRCKQNDNIQFGSNWASYNFNYIAGCELSRVSDTSYTLNVQPWQNSLRDNNTIGGWGYLGNITAIYGLL